MNLLPILRRKIVGHSMEPTFISDDIAYFRPYFFSRPKIGDIILFRRENKEFVKRIKKIKGSKYFVQGDNFKDSLDSNVFGSIKRTAVIGKAF